MKLLGVIIFSCISVFVSGLPQYPNEPQDIRRNYEDSNRIPAPRDLYNSERINEWEVYPNSLKYRSLDSSRREAEAEEEEAEVDAEGQRAEEQEESEPKGTEEGETSKREEPSKEGEREAEEGETSKREEVSKEGEKEAEKEQPEGEGESQRRKGEEGEQAEGEAAKKEPSEQGEEKPQAPREEQQSEQEAETEQEAQPETEAEPGTEREAEAEAEAEAGQEAKPETEAETGAERGAEGEAEAEAEQEAEAVAKPDPEPKKGEAVAEEEAGAEGEAEQEAEAGAEVEREAGTETEPEAEVDVAQETEAEQDAGAAGEAEAEQDAEAEAEAEAKRTSQGEQSESGAEAAEGEGQQEGEAAEEEKLTIIQEEPEVFEAVSDSSSQPEQTQEGSQPEAPKEGSQPEEPQVDSQTEAPQEGSQPAEPQEGSQPEGPQEGSQREEPQDGPQPEQPQEDSQPGEQSPESSTEALELRTEEPRSDVQESTDTSLSFDAPAEDQSVMLEPELELSPEKEQSTEPSPESLREEDATVASDSFLLNEETRADLQDSASEVVTEKLVEEPTEPKEEETPVEPAETAEARTDEPSELVREGKPETTDAPADTVLMMEEQEAEPSFDGIVSDALRQRMEGSALLSMIRERETAVATDAPEEVVPTPTESQVCADAVDALLSAFAESFETESPITAFEVGKTYSLFAYGLGTLMRDGEVTITKDPEGRRMISSNIRIGPVTITNQADAEKRVILEFTYSGKIELLLDESVTPPALTVLTFDLGTLEDGGVTLINQANPEDKELLFESVVSAMSTRLKLRSLYRNLFTSLAEREEISSKFSLPTEESHSKKLEYVIS